MINLWRDSQISTKFITKFFIVVNMQSWGFKLMPGFNCFGREVKNGQQGS